MACERPVIWLVAQPEPIPAKLMSMINRLDVEFIWVDPQWV
jgi:hypothetical protein